MTARQISTTILPVPFFMVLSSDHVTPATGKTPVVQLSKNGAAFAATSGAISETGNGWYSWAGNATDRDTIGEHAFRATAAGCDETPGKLEVTWHDPFGTTLNNTLTQATTAATQATTAATQATTAATQATAANTAANAAAAAATTAATQATTAATQATAAAQSADSAAVWAIAAVNRLGPFTADVSENTVFGSLRALASTAAAQSPDLVSGGLGFTPANHSLQTLRARIDAVSGGGGGGGGGSGSNAVTITVRDGAAAPIQNATVTVTQGAEQYSVLTSAGGVATFALNSATWTVSVYRAGYQLSPQTLVVSGTTAVTYTMAVVTFAASTPPRVTGFLYTYSEAGVIESGVTVTMQLLYGPDAGVGYDTAPRTTVSDVNGKVEFANLFKGATYLLSRGTAQPAKITIPRSGTATAVAIGPVAG